MAKKLLEQYRGELSASDVAAGMNAAQRNAARLFEDAKLLLEAGRYPSAASLAILSIEEAGKVSILRELATAKTKAELGTAWRRYRDHRAKNVGWIIADLARDGARSLDDFRRLYDKDSDHPELLDGVKQLGFYTDCYANKHWSEPIAVIDEAFARSMVFIAEVMCKGRDEVSNREIELWIEHLGPYMGTAWMPLKLIDFYNAMREEGLTKFSLEHIRRFVWGD